jgi:ABC-type lipoprotein release transport system permease subunit
MSDKKVDLKLLRRLAILLRREDFDEAWAIEVEDAADLIKYHQDSGEEQQKHINTLTNEKLTLQAKIEELKEFVKHDYISMKNWQEEKATLESELRRCKTVLHDYIDNEYKEEGE